MLYPVASGLASQTNVVLDTLIAPLAGEDNVTQEGVVAGISSSTTPSKYT